MLGALLRRPAEHGDFACESRKGEGCTDIFSQI